MPRLTEASARARRDEIVAAAIRVMARKGLAHTSVADISAESGLSAGSIYSHFSGRGEIGLQVATSVIGRRARRLSAATVPLAPAEIVERFLTEDDGEVPVQLVLQMWAEATVDPEIRAIFDGVMRRLSATYADAVRPWAAMHGGDAEDYARGMMALAQAYIVRAALMPGDESVAQLATLLRTAIGSDEP